MKQPHRKKLSLLDTLSIIVIVGIVLYALIVGMPYEDYIVKHVPIIVQGISFTIIGVVHFVFAVYRRYYKQSAKSNFNVYGWGAMYLFIGILSIYASSY
jgi:uncharacterized membrane protein